MQTTASVPSVRASAGRNQTIDVLRIVAAVAIVLIHAKLPGDAGIAATALARFAVPFFFATSGYFSVGIDERKIRRRCCDVLRLALCGDAIYLAYGLVRAKLVTGTGIKAYLASTFILPKVAKWVFMQLDPIAFHLWYLYAMVVVYLLLLVYCLLVRNAGAPNVTGSSNEAGVPDTESSVVTLRGKVLNPLYMLGACCVVLLIFCDLLLRGAGTEVSHLAYRNALLLGLPMFLMGMFVRERGGIRRGSTAGALIVVGLLLCLLQQFGMGKAEVPIGALVLTFALLSYAREHPSLRGLDWLSDRMSLADVSLAMYIVHILVRDAILDFAPTNSACAFMSQPLVFPYAVIALSLFAGIVYGWAKRSLAIRGSRRPR